MNKIERKKHVVDATGKAIGRISSDIAMILQGKNKPTYVPNIDSGDFVEVHHAADVKLSATKSIAGFHIRHSGQPGGLKKVSLAVVRKTHPDQLISHAVYSMLPPNKMRTARMKRLTFVS